MVVHRLKGWASRPDDYIRAISRTLAPLNTPPDYVTVSGSVGFWSPNFVRTKNHRYATLAGAGTPGGSPLYVTAGYLNGSHTPEDVDNFVVGPGLSACGFAVVGACETFSINNVPTATEIGVGIPGIGVSGGYTNRLSPPSNGNSDAMPQIPLGDGLYYTLKRHGIKYGTAPDLMWKCFWEFVIGAGFLCYGLTRKPLQFNPANPVKRAMPVYLARLIYLPIGVAVFTIAIRDAVTLICRAK